MLPIFLTSFCGMHLIERNATRSARNDPVVLSLPSDERRVITMHQGFFLCTTFTLWRVLTVVVNLMVIGEDISKLFIIYKLQPSTFLGLKVKEPSKTEHVDKGATEA